ncbi:hypothetical protein BDV96DRAFT_600508 [Lophiotrema nucula]|uniref:C2H2-type domain-containing protein n=1 Tax=Lophiotrema nucula TaxID=690887 RepID=A0A6A5Z529_9PLEO|nr:hypothetical protein BDV96DRAFT_600508 [Lophiotrema nucula]
MSDASTWEEFDLTAYGASWNFTSPEADTCDTSTLVRSERNDQKQQSEILPTPWISSMPHLSTIDYEWFNVDGFLQNHLTQVSHTRTDESDQPPCTYSVSLALGHDEGPPSSTTNPAPTVQNTNRIQCSECKVRSFGRDADRKRHISEQHRCSHQDCTGRKFTKQQLKDHRGYHGNQSADYRCGSCELRGRSKTTFKRGEKLRNHFVSIHNAPKRFVFDTFACLNSGCYHGGYSGGVYFISLDDLDRHRHAEHGPTGNERAFQTANRRRTRAKTSSKHERASHNHYSGTPWGQTVVQQDEANAYAWSGEHIGARKSSFVTDNSTTMDEVTNDEDCWVLDQSTNLWQRV